MARVRKPVKKCPHGRRRERCRDCGGGSICPHGNLKQTCHDCGGCSICPHGKQKSRCLECGGSSICKHKRNKYSCRECGGNGICQHGQRRVVCRDCGGNGLCEHKRAKAQCRECGGASICQHRRLKKQCPECGGSSICEHGFQRHHCRDCNHFICDLEGCGMQGHRFAGAASLLGHMRSFHGDNPKALTKSKELEVHQLLGKSGLLFEYQHHLPFRGCGLESETSRAFADFVLYTPWGAIILEVDERQHSHQDPSCDVRRDFDMAASVALGSQHKLAIVRYNPDPFKVAGRTVRTAKNARHSKLLELLHRLLQEKPERPFQRLFLFYDRAAEDSELPAIAEEWDVVARTVSRAVQ